MALLLSIAQLPRATYYYHVRQFEKPDKYDKVKDEITAIYHEHKGRYGYHRITTEMHHRGFTIILKTELLYLQKFQSMEHFKAELIEYLNYNNHRAKAKREGLPPALHRQ